MDDENQVFLMCLLIFIYRFLLNGFFPLCIYHFLFIYSFIYLFIYLFFTVCPGTDSPERVLHC